MKIDRGNLIFLCVIALTASVAIVIAQTEPNDLPAEDESVLLDQQDSGLVFADEIQHSEPGETFNNQTVQSINFRQDMSVRDALRFLAAKYRKNIIPSAKVNFNLVPTYNHFVIEGVNPPSENVVVLEATTPTALIVGFIPATIELIMVTSGVIYPAY